MPEDWDKKIIALTLFICGLTLLLCTIAAVFGKHNDTKEPACQCVRLKGGYND